MSIVTIYGEDAPRVYPLSWIYDPDKHGSDIAASGKIVPQVTSQIVDDLSGLHNQLYTVTAVDPETKKVTMVPTSIVQTDDGMPDRILSYGNDIYMLYYAEVQLTDQTTNITRSLTRLAVDNKLALFGNHAAQYELVRVLASGEKVVISENYDTNNHYIGTRVALSETVPGSGIRKCNICYTGATIADNEEIYAYIYDGTGILIAIVGLITKKALILSEISDNNNPIVDFYLAANQMLGNNDIILHTNQNKKELVLYPIVVFADGTKQTVVLDNTTGFLYGMEDVSTVYEGRTYELTAKYYIGDTPASSSLVQGVTSRFISCTAKLRITAESWVAIGKITVIPKFVGSKVAPKWLLDFYAYSADRKHMTAVAPEVVGFNNTLMDETQTVTVTVNQVNNEGVIIPYVQTFCIKLFNILDPTRLSQLPPYLIWDPNDPTIIYGDNTAPHYCPVIYYKQVTDTETGVVTNTYRIPEENYPAAGTMTSVDTFIENFYERSNPPIRTSDPDVQELLSQSPTHFVIRYGRDVITPERIDVNDFATTLGLINRVSGTNPSYLHKTLTVEFLVETTTEPSTAPTYDLLFGVPVVVLNEPQITEP